MLSTLHRDRSTLIATSAFTVLTLFWLYTRFVIGSTDGENIHNQLFTLTYGLMALFGGLLGVNIARRWGGTKSLIGRSILAFAFGLLMQELGQVIYAIYIYALQVEVPYPSFGDIGYFGSVLCYIYGAWLLAKAAGARFSFSSLANKFQALVIPLILLFITYTFFLKGYSFEGAQPLTVFLDFGYPLGQAIYISIAILAYLLSRKLLGGVMRPVILTFIAALIVQYASDFTFLYQNYHETWYPAGINDFMYLVSYFMMTLALIRIGKAAKPTQVKA